MQFFCVMTQLIIISPVTQKCKTRPWPTAGLGLQALVPQRPLCGSVLVLWQTSFMTSVLGLKFSPLNLLCYLGTTTTPTRRPELRRVSILIQAGGESVLPQFLARYLLALVHGWDRACRTRTLSSDKRDPFLLRGRPQGSQSPSGTPPSLTFK